MKTIIALLVIIYSNVTAVYARDVYVRGYVRSNGEYVMPSHRTSPDSNPYNNYNSNVNVNPYHQEEISPPAYQQIHVPSYNSETGMYE